MQSPQLTKPLIFPFLKKHGAVAKNLKMSPLFNPPTKMLKTPLNHQTQRNLRPRSNLKLMKEAPRNLQMESALMLTQISQKG